jgi:hypothetical protein
MQLFSPSRPRRRDHVEYTSHMKKWKNDSSLCRYVWPLPCSTSIAVNCIVPVTTVYESCWLLQVTFGLIVFAILQSWLIAVSFERIHWELKSIKQASSNSFRNPSPAMQKNLFANLIFINFRTAGSLVLACKCSNLRRRWSCGSRASRPSGRRCWGYRSSLRIEHGLGHRGREAERPDELADTSLRNSVLSLRDS